jgi:hypothetical protein
MRIAVALAFVIVAVSPLVGIWWGHVWAKANCLVLRSSVLRMTGPSSVEQNQNRQAA